MWFRVLSFLIALALLVKAAVALTASRRFYARRQQQYSSETLPAKLLIPPAVVLTLTLAAWFATIFHYRPWGWLVTGFLSVLSCLSLHHLFHWAKHRQAMLKLVSNPKVKQIDCLLLAMGLGFLALALVVY
jgi:hypothetical protein